MPKDSLPDFNSMWDYSKPVETRSKFNEVLENVGSFAGDDYTLQLKTQIARTYSLKANFVEAHSTLDEVEASLNDNTHTARVRYLLERGRTFNSAGDKEEARGLFIKAFEYGRKLEDVSYSVDAAHMNGIAAEDVADKLKWNKKGLEQARISKDKKTNRWVGVFLNNMGWDSFEAKMYEDALIHFKECRDYYKGIESKDRLKIAWWSIAKTYRLLGKLNESLEIQLRLLEENDGIDKSGYGQEELAELYLLKGEKEKSREWSRKAFQILSSDLWLQKNEPERLARLKEMSL